MTGERLVACGTARKASLYLSGPDSAIARQR